MNCETHILPSPESLSGPAHSPWTLGGVAGQSPGGQLCPPSRVLQAAVLVGTGAGQRLGSPASALQLGDLSASHRGPGLGVPSAPARTDSFYQLPGQARGPSAHTVLRAWHTVPTADRDDLRFLEEKVEVAGGQGSQWGI